MVKLGRYKRRENARCWVDRCRSCERLPGPTVRRNARCQNLAGELGFEPRQTESESVVLPLHHSPPKHLIYQRFFRKFFNGARKFSKSALGCRPYSWVGVRGPVPSAAPWSWLANATGAIMTFMNLMWKFTACAAVLGCAMILSGAACARGGGGGGGGGFHGGGGFYGGRGGFYGGRGGFYGGGRGGLHADRGGLHGDRGGLHGDRGGFQGGGGFHNGVPIGGQGEGGFHNGVPIGDRYIDGGSRRGGDHHGRGHHHQSPVRAPLWTLVTDEITCS
jgi:hypothetical protein